MKVVVEVKDNLGAIRNLVVDVIEISQDHLHVIHLGLARTFRLSDIRDAVRIDDGSSMQNFLEKVMPLVA